MKASNVKEGLSLYQSLGKEKSIVSIGYSHIVLNDRQKGTVVAFGDNEHGECNVSTWRDISYVFAGDYYTLGVKFDGTICLAGGGTESSGIKDFEGICVKKVFPGSDSLIAIQKNGTYLFSKLCESLLPQADKDFLRTANIKQIVYARNFQYENKFVDAPVYALLENGCVYPLKGAAKEVKTWRDITQVVIHDNVTGGNTVFGLKKDGTVLAAGNVSKEESAVSEWKDIISILDGSTCLFGLKKDGTVLCTGKDAETVSKWNNIIQIARSFITVGLTNDGRVLFAEDYPTSDSWLSGSEIAKCDDIIGIEDGPNNIVAISASGKIYICGRNSSKECKGNGEVIFDDIKNVVTYQRKRENRCAHCGGRFKGFIIKKCSNCGKKKDYK